MELPADNGLGLEAIAERVPIRYTIPYEWGSFKVTESAHETYKLTPLTADTVEGDHDAGLKRPPYLPLVNVYLLSPREMGTDVSRHDDAYWIHTNKVLTKDSVNLGIAISATAEQLKKINIDLLARYNEIPPEEAEELLDEDDITYGERLENETPQQIVHNIVDQVEVAGEEGIHEWLGRTGDEVAYKKIRAMGLISIIGAFGADGAAELFGANATTAELAAIGYGATMLTLTARELKKYLRIRQSLNTPYSIAAKAYASGIANDIHANFCTSYFDSLEAGFMNPHAADGGFPEVG